MYAIGFLELSSIAQGMLATDAILKAAGVQLIFARESCPGKYYIMFKGETDAVQASLQAGIAVADFYLVDSTLISRVAPEVIKALGQVTVPDEIDALGVMEFFSVTAAIYAADSAVKTAGVSILNLRLGTGMCGKSYVTLTGDVSAVQEAVKTAAALAGENGMLLTSNVMAKPAKELYENLY